MFGWILNAVYLGLLAVLSPVLVWQSWRTGKYRKGWSEKFLGRLPVRASASQSAPAVPCVWFHAVSVGEVLLLGPVLKRLRAERPEIEAWLSITTQTGHDVARDKYPECRVVYFPLDFTWAVSNAITRVRPSLVVLVELELWPNFIRSVDRAGIPLVLINGRMSERSFRGYRRIRPLIASILRRFARLGMQSEEYRARLVELGAPPERTEVTGSVKFDGLESDRANPKTAALRAAFGLRENDRVLIAGSTQAPEEELALNTFAALRTEFPDLRLILVPRHKERFEEVARLVLARGFSLVRRSVGTVEGGSDPAPVLLLDTLGELGACWGLADIAFVGGSLTNRGGQNMMEPSAYGAAVLFGPNTQNFRQVVELLLSNSAAEVVHSGEELTATVQRLLTDTALARHRGDAARNLVLAQQGATERTVRMLLDGLPVAKPAR